MGGNSVAKIGRGPCHYPINSGVLCLVRCGWWRLGLPTWAVVVTGLNTTRRITAAVTAGQQLHATASSKKRSAANSTASALGFYGGTPSFRFRPFSVFLGHRGHYMRLLTVAAALIFTLSVIGQNQHRSAKHDTKATKVADDTKQDDVALSAQKEISAVERTKRSESEQHNSNPEAKPWLTHGEWVMAVLTAIYVSITAFYAWVSHKTLRAIEEQTERAKDSTKAARDAADAALRNANALIDAERAHLIIEFIHRDGTWYALSVYNLGKTPAYVDHFAFVRHFYPIDEPLPQNFRDHQFVGHRELINRVLPYGESRIILERDFAELLNEAQRAGKQMAIFRGSVTYRDIFGKEHQAELVYRYDSIPSGGYELINLPQHNRYT